MQTSDQNLRSILLKERDQKLSERINIFSEFMACQKLTYLRIIDSPADREVTIKDPFSGALRRMLMFASNNYLGLANHPYIKLLVKKTVDKYGCGIGGPPLLNGYIKLIEEAEERLAALKCQESAMLFSSGFLANVALASTLALPGDLILYDEFSHASFYDSIKLTKARAISFQHNNVKELESLLACWAGQIQGTIFVCVEGVYSMDGNIAPLVMLSAICKKYGCMLIIDDAHSTGVLGKNGSGTASHLQFGSNNIDIIMGTFSKAFATCGGFLAGNKDLVTYLRFHARPYIFSASIPPPVIATVLGGLDIMEKEPWLQMQLLDNAKYAAAKLKAYEFCAPPEAAIIAVKLPAHMDIRKAALLFHQKNIFINAIEYPAVPAGQERFRISIMATHTKSDIDELAKAVDEVWNDKNAYSY